MCCLAQVSEGANLRAGLNADKRLYGLCRALFDFQQRNIQGRRRAKSIVLIEDEPLGFAIGKDGEIVHK